MKTRSGKFVSRTTFALLLEAHLPWKFQEFSLGRFLETPERGGPLKGFSTYVKYCFFNTETLHIFNLNNAIVKISQHIFKIVITVWWLPISFHIILWEPNRSRFFSFLVTETGAGNMVLIYFSDRRAIQEGWHSYLHS